jgi:low affinity Fe/Cu permease
MRPGTGKDASRQQKASNGIEAEAMNKHVSGKPPSANEQFGRFASTASSWLGSKWAFVAAGLIIIAWGVTGPLFHYSDTWQLVINTGTTIVTFLMVFLIQNTQNRDARAINLKLDELIHAIGKARDQMINIEKLSDVELDVLAEQFDEMPNAESKRQARQSRQSQEST